MATPQALARRGRFLLAALMTTVRAYRSLSTYVGLGAAVVAATGLRVLAHVPIPYAAGVALAVLAGEAAYREWDRWAPHDPPLIRTDLAEDMRGVRLIITNDDPAGIFRVAVTAIEAGSDMPAKGLPWDLPWDRRTDLSRRIERGEPAGLTLMGYDHAAVAETMAGHYQRPAYHFPGPAGTDRTVMGLVNTREDLVLTVHLRVMRVEPAPASVERHIRVTFGGAAEFV